MKQLAEAVGNRAQEGSWSSGWEHSVYSWRSASRGEDEISQIEYVQRAEDQIEFCELQKAGNEEDDLVNETVERSRREDLFRGTSTFEEKVGETFK